MPPKTTHTPEQVEKLRISEGRDTAGPVTKRSRNRGNGTNRDLLPTDRPVEPRPRRTIFG